MEMVSKPQGHFNFTYLRWHSSSTANVSGLNPVQTKGLFMWLHGFPPGKTI